ncbi:putative kelch-type beta propeller [Helianthus debilis subsp. tardiflorus]
MGATGKVSVARGGQSVTLAGSKLIMFGGEDKHRHLMNDVHVLDLEMMTWNAAETICFRDIGDGYAQACYLGFDECKGKTPTCQRGNHYSKE